MGTCESFFRNTLSPQKSQKIKLPEKKISPKKNQGSNYFNTPIGSNHISINNLSNSNTSQSYLMFTSSNQNQKPSLLIYQNNSTQNSYLNGSSKLTHDSLSSGKEYIVDGKINNDIDNDQGFNHFMAQKEKDINAIIEENNENINSDNNNDKNNNNKENHDNNSDKNKNKKDVNIYHNKINNKNRGNKKKTKKNKNLNKIIEQKKEAFPQGLPIPLDSS